MNVKKAMMTTILVITITLGLFRSQMVAFQCEVNDISCKLNYVHIIYAGGIMPLTRLNQMNYVIFDVLILIIILQPRPYMYYDTSVSMATQAVFVPMTC